MFKRPFLPLTLTCQLALIVLLSAIIAITYISVAGWLDWGVQGNAHAINKAGSLRMQSYRLLSAILLPPTDRHWLDEIETTTFSNVLTQAARQDGEMPHLDTLQSHWHDTLKPLLLRAQHPDDARESINHFVENIDCLVTAFDRGTEQRIKCIVVLQQTLAVLMGFLFLFSIIWLQRRLLHPWRQSWQKVMAHLKIVSPKN